MVEKKAEVEGIGLFLETAGDCPPVKADPGQLQQVLVNLLNNAIDAVAQKRPPEGGLVEVRIGPAGQEVEIRVRDNGVGISPEDLDKIFTPFFTTKPVGQGTGLGLPVCFGIIDKMGGRIIVASQEGQGATFTVLLPAAGLRPRPDDWRGAGRGPAPDGGEDGQGQDNARG
jgi:two-component system NtrC family sensor kinase